MRVKTSELEGAALDWAVAKSKGWQMIDVPPDIDGKNGGQVLAPPSVGKDWKFPNRGKVGQSYFVRQWSTDWSHGGPILSSLIWPGFEIAKCLDRFVCSNHTDEGLPYSGNWDDPEIREGGSTPLIAACRAIVAAKLGGSVDVPDELVQ